MIARFIGEDGSLGYRHGEVYLLRLEEQGNYIMIMSPRFCPYSSWKNFFENWEPVRKVLTDEGETVRL